MHEDLNMLRGLRKRRVGREAKEEDVVGFVRIARRRKRVMKVMVIRVGSIFGFGVWGAEGIDLSCLEGSMG